MKISSQISFILTIIVSTIFVANEVFANAVSIPKIDYPALPIQDWVEIKTQSVDGTIDPLLIWPRNEQSNILKTSNTETNKFKEIIKRNNLQALQKNIQQESEENSLVSSKSLIIQNIKDQEKLDLNDEKTNIPSAAIQRSSNSSSEENGFVTWPTDSDLIKKYGWFKWYQQALLLEVIDDKEILWSLDNTLARRKVEELTNRYNSLNNQYLDVISRKSETDDSYRQLILWLKLNKDAIDTSTASINKRIAKIQSLDEKIKDVTFKLRLTAPTLKQSQEELTRYTQMFLKMNNDLFIGKSENKKVSNVKLFTKHDNIAETLASDIMVKDLTIKLDELVEKIWWLRTQYALQSKNLESYSSQVKNEVAIYQEEQETLQQQIENYEEFMLYVKSNKAYIDSKKQALEKEKKVLAEQEDLIKLMDEAETTEELEEIKQKMKEIIKDESRFFDFPITTVSKLTSFFEDEWYNKTFGVSHHYALDFRLAQWSFVYAPADGYVYKIINQNSSMLNRFIVLHQNNLATVYLHMQDIYVKPGQYINRWDIMWLSGWTPGTRGAWYMTTWPHLHREVWKWWQVVDPLLYTDLSKIDSANMLQIRHEDKWETDHDHQH